jgi:hypothetical protein
MRWKSLENAKCLVGKCFNEANLKFLLNFEKEIENGLSIAMMK